MVFTDNFFLIEKNLNFFIDHESTTKDNEYISSIELIEPYKFKLEHIGGNTFDEEDLDDNEPHFYLKKITDDEFMEKFLLNN